MVSSTIIHAIDHETYRHDGLVVWGAGLKAPDNSLVLVRVPLLSYCRHFYTNYCILYFEHLHIVYSTIIHAIDHKT